MRYVVDTHTLLWYLSGDSRLGREALRLLIDPQADLIIPVLVLAEAKHAADRKRVSVAFETVLQSVGASPRINVFPMDIFTVNFLPTQLDIHDSIIVATARFCHQFLNEEIAILTNDLQITQSGLLPVIW